MSKEKLALSGKHISDHFPHIPKTVCVCCVYIYTYMFTILKDTDRRLKLPPWKSSESLQLLKQRTSQASLVKWAVNWNLPSVVITQALSSFPACQGPGGFIMSLQHFQPVYGSPRPQRNRSSNFQKETFIFNMDWFFFKGSSKQPCISNRAHHTNPNTSRGSFNAWCLLFLAGIRAARGHHSARCFLSGV